MSRPAPRAAPAIPALPEGVRRVREERAGGPVPLFPQPEWRRVLPWVVQGTTGRGAREAPFDLGLFGAAPAGAVLARWRELRSALGGMAAAHAHQVHGADVRTHEAAPDDGLVVQHGFDGHATTRPGLLMAVSVADCVPIFMVDPGARRVVLLHGGWRGTAAGIVGRGLEAMDGADPAGVHVHLGPAICGGCYEVGPEVHDALGLPVPRENTPVDVRAVQARQLVEAGVPPGQVTVSEHCTRCGEGFFSHRGGDRERQMGVLGIRR